MKLVRTAVEVEIEDKICKVQGHVGAVLGAPNGPPTFMCTRCGKTLEFEMPPAVSDQTGPRTPSMGLVTPGA
jgi:hypothetical protein